MQFNSPVYAFFLIIVFFVFWFLLRKNLRLQNIFILSASYFFYSWWDWRFLSLIIFISSVNYYAGILIGKMDPDNESKKRKFVLLVSIIINLGLLGIFKYFNFFADSAVDLLNAFGFKADKITLNIILPIGISFYTFQSLSYTIDVYRGKFAPAKDIVAFFAYISFFPLLLAGPIERGDTLLPQFFKQKEFKYEEAVNGMRQILWGLFKKVVIADNCAIVANQIFDHYKVEPSSVLIAGAFYFALQIYGDFSGYSDIAIGSARLLGFRLTTNFKTPYFSRDIAEFWRRWHISLSTWLRDYLFMPLNLQFRRYRASGGTLAVMITFLLCGLWHGANWTFIVWGGINGLYFIPLILLGSTGKNINPVAEDKIFPTFREIFRILLTFGLTCFAWIFFKAETTGQAFEYIKGIFTHKPLPSSSTQFPKNLLYIITFFVLAEWFFYRFDEPFDRFSNLSPVIRNAIYALTLALIFLFIQNKATTFIYFQF
jgi:alginate O-acetyltransferase complex protein AlgI